MQQPKTSGGYDLPDIRRLAPSLVDASIQLFDVKEQTSAFESLSKEFKSGEASMATHHQSYSDIYGITDHNLRIRREFLRLGDKDQQLLTELIPWIEQQAAPIAKEFYDWQFQFSRTRAFFEARALETNMPLTTLRQHLESAQAGYLKDIFNGAATGWGLEYFEKRLKVGAVHDAINLPFKWYIGSYAEFQRLIRSALVKSFPKRKLDWVMDVCDAFARVTNYDMQAIGDSFLLNTLSSVGLDIASVKTTNVSDRTEHLQEIKDMVKTILDQAQAIAQHHINDAVLDRVVPGRLGEAFAEMVGNTRRFGQLIVESSNVLNTVSASAAEMSSSIKEISNTSANGSRVARAAVETAEQATVIVGKLGESSKMISQVLKVITSIAEQTNLLALNATIEAARAGDAGRGFAVVANEVKTLAKETASATEDIRQRVSAIQEDTQKAVEAIDSMRNTIQEIDSFSNTIAAAVEEQTIVTNEIARNVAEAAQGTSEIAAAVAGQSASSSAQADPVPSPAAPRGQATSGGGKGKCPASHGLHSQHAHG